MSACLIVAGKAMMLAMPLFSLGWTHSVEKVEWREQWRVESGALVLEEARIRGSGAGMEPPPEARRIDGWYVWQPSRRESRITLAASGKTGAGWQLCSAGTCQALGVEAGSPVVLEPCQ